MELNFKGCQIDGGILNGSSVGDNNGIINGENNSISKYSLDDFVDCMDEIIMNSNVRSERNCAIKAKRLAEKSDSVGLKRYVMENMGTFFTGTFATTAGGFLQEFIKSLI